MRNHKSLNSHSPQKPDACAQIIADFLAGPDG